MTRQQRIRRVFVCQLQDPARVNASPAHSGAHGLEPGLLGVRGRIGHDVRVLYAERVQGS